MTERAAALTLATAQALRSVATLVELAHDRDSGLEPPERATVSELARRILIRTRRDDEHASHPQAAPAAREATRGELAITPIPPFQLFTIPAAAKLLGVGQSWLYIQLRAGRIASVQLGGNTSKQRIRADDLAAFIASRHFGPAGAQR